MFMDIGRNNTTLNIDDMVASLFSKEMREHNMEIVTHEDLMVRV